MTLTIQMLREYPRLSRATLRRRLNTLTTLTKVTMAAFAYAFAFSSSAHAALGGDAASVNTDRAVLAASTSASAATASVQAKKMASSATSSTSDTAPSSAVYTMQSLVDSGGTTIHEYLDSSGAVFAIAWSGPFMPDLSQLLGSYFADYTGAVAAKRDSLTVRSPVVIDNGELVVNSGGHMRAYRGAAYLKSRLPSGFTVDQIR